MGDFASLLFYIIFFLLSFICYYIYNKRNYKIFLFLSFIIPTIIGGFRYFVGTDYPTYIGLYNNGSNVGIGFSIITSISAKFNGVQTMFFLYNFLTLLFVFWGLKNLDKKVRPFAYFCFLFLYYTTSFNIMRQYLALSIIFYAYKYILKKEPIKWIVFVLIAFCFHNTAILCAPFYVVLNCKNKKIKILTLVVTCIIALNYNTILKSLSNLSLFEHYEMYSNEYADTINNKMFYVDIITLLYICVFRKKLLKCDEKNDIYIWLYIISVIISLTGFFNPYVKRMAIYFGISKIILLSEIPFVCSDKNNKIINYAFVFLYSIGLFIISTYILKQANIIPYNMIGG